ncbi:MAG: homoserine O-acetyltransferase, partial [Micrococcaceae bacterium]|nr:homoserine O-acetyltransferase [Micrococcaceae bacterium]
MTATVSRPPRAALPEGGRHRLRIGELRTETGGVLPDVELAYETWGELDADGSNAVLVLHALTGDSHVAAHAADPTPGWWDALV